MIQAATAGVVDFGKADPRDPRWWLSLRLILGRLEQENIRECHELYYDQVMAVLGRDWLTQESYDRLFDAADNKTTAIARIRFPWANLDPRANQMQETARLKASWEAVFGKLDDPETQRRIQATADWLHRTDKPRQGRR
jgi:hypothetical protein